MFQCNDKHSDGAGSEAGFSVITTGHLLHFFEMPAALAKHLMPLE